jgi:peroxiredoxin
MLHIEGREGMRRLFAVRTGIGTLPLVLILIVAFAGALLLYRNWQTGVGSKQEGREASPPGGPAALRAAPPFSLPDTNGNVFSSDRLAGKAVVINFFATWCPPCREEIPGFVEVYKRYRGEGFELIGISLDKDTRGNLPGFIVQNRIEYRILFGDLPTARAYGGVSSIPTTFFVGKDGAIKNVVVGYIDQDTFDSEVKKLL